VTRRELYHQLQEEAAQGWPVPYWPQDLPRPPKMMDRDQAVLLARYVDIVTEAVTSEPVGKV
jgi:hypothetical protein